MLLILGTVAATLAALAHVYIWMLESLLWGRPSVRRMFGVRTDAEAETLRPMAYNQGFYNLFLALGAIAGIVLAWSEPRTEGLVLAAFSCMCMALAALVLVASAPRMLRAALIQGVVPLIAVGFLAAQLAIELTEVV